MLSMDTLNCSEKMTKMHAGVGVLDPARRRVGLKGRGSLFGLDVVELVSAWRASPCLTPTQSPAPILQILTYPCLNQGEERGKGKGRRTITRQ